MRIVLDTNIYIAAYFGTGLSSDILELGSARKLDLYTSVDILLEIEEKLTGKYQAEAKDLREFLDLVNMSTTLVAPQKELKIIERDPDDNKIIECAVEARAGLIITLDKDLLTLKSYEGIGIIHPKAFTWVLPRLFDK